MASTILAKLVLAMLSIITLISARDDGFLQASEESYRSSGIIALYPHFNSEAVKSVKPEWQGCLDANGMAITRFDNSIGQCAIFTSTYSAPQRGSVQPTITLTSRTEFFTLFCGFRHMGDDPTGFRHIDRFKFGCEQEIWDSETDGIHGLRFIANGTEPQPIDSKHTGYHRGLYTIGDGAPGHLLAMIGKTLVASNPAAQPGAGYQWLMAAEWAPQPGKTVIPPDLTGSTVVNSTLAPTGTVAVLTATASTESASTASATVAAPVQDEVASSLIPGNSAAAHRGGVLPVV